MKIIEFLLPHLKLKRIERELDAKERAGAVEYYIHFWTVFWPKMQWDIFNREPLYKKFIKRR
jgi:hypothetical protein